LGALGGIIAFFALLKRRFGIGIVMLLLGIIVTFVEYFVIRNMVSNALSNIDI